MSETKETPKPADVAGRFDGLVGHLREACNGHPFASVPWPHRLLHDAADEIERLRKGYLLILVLTDSEMQDGDKARDIADEMLTPNAAVKPRRSDV